MRRSRYNLLKAHSELRYVQPRNFTKALLLTVYFLNTYVQRLKLEFLLTSIHLLPLSYMYKKVWDDVFSLGPAYSEFGCDELSGQNKQIQTKIGKIFKIYSNSRTQWQHYLWHQTSNYKQYHKLSLVTSQYVYLIFSHFSVFHTYWIYFRWLSF